MTANVFGIVFLVLGIINIIFLALQFAIFTNEFLADFLELYELDLALDTITLYTSLIAFELPPILILITSGISLLRSKVKTKPWKSLYHTLRYVFIGFSAVISLFCIIATVGWIFYNPSTSFSTPLYIWTFILIEVIISISTWKLYLVLLSVYLITVILLVLPPIIDYIKEKLKKDESMIEEDASSEEDIKLEIAEKKQIIFITRTELEAIEKRKGPMSEIFYKIKNTPLIKSMELLGLSMIVSFAIVLLFSRFATEDTPDPSEIDPFAYMIQLAWAGVFEETRKLDSDYY
jgi:hypothetical protein